MEVRTPLRTLDSSPVGSFVSQRDRREAEEKEAGMIAVMGASGNVGSKTAERLLQDGQAVRAFGRSAERLEPLRKQGADVLVGDALNTEDLQALFRDAEAALVVLPDNVADPEYASNRSRMNQAIVQALAHERVGHVVMASSLGAERDRGVGPVNTLHELEELLFGLDGTNVLSNRAALHMEQNFLPVIPLVLTQRINATAIRPDLKMPMIATVDIAERVASHLVSRDFSGHSVETVLGPEDLTMEEATQALGDTLGITDARYIQLPPEDATGALQGAGMSREFASLLVEMQVTANEGLFDEVVRTPEATTPTTIHDFLRSAVPTSTGGGQGG
jgi:uncharacterized protein YbjT (DUF2867 family)